MNKIFSVLILLFVSAFMSAVAAVPTWTVNPNDYNYSMTVTAVINLDGVESVDTNDILAAFVDGQCRGVVKPLYNASTGRYIAYLIVYSNSVSETVVLKVYDASADAERTITQPITFVVDGALGKTVSPLIVSDPTLSNEAEITGFSISGQTGSTIFDTNSISLLMPHGTDLSALIPTFVTSPLATVTVGGIVQQSGVSVNDMSSPVEYTVRSADETTTQTYRKSVV